MTKRRARVVKAPKREYIRDAFDELPAGACYQCHELIWSNDEMTIVSVQGRPMRRHQPDCVSAEVPW